MAKVAVILTVYKRTKYLLEALDSVLGQTFADFEVIIADDSGDAAASEIIAKRADSRIRYMANNRTMGVAASVAKAVSEARAELIGIVNDDDVWGTEFLAELTAPFAEHDDIVVAWSDYWLMTADGMLNKEATEPFSKRFGRLPEAGGMVNDLVKCVVVTQGIGIAQAAVFKRSAVDWSLVGSEVGGAYDFWISCLLAGSRQPGFYVPKRLARWRVHEEMESHRKDYNRGDALVYIYSTLLFRGWFKEFEAKIRAELVESLVAAARNKLDFGRFRDARRYFWSAFQISGDPSWFGRAVMTLLPDCIVERVRRRFLRCGAVSGREISAAVE